jgi:hypothetical protein
MSSYDHFSYDTDREVYSAARARALEALLIPIAKSTAQLGREHWRHC